MCAFSKIKLRRTGEGKFGEVVVRVSGTAGGRVREGMALILNEWLLRSGVEWKEVSSRLMLVRVQIERESQVFISAYGPSSQRNKEEIEEF